MEFHRIQKGNEEHLVLRPGDPLGPSGTEALAGYPKLIGSLRMGTRDNVRLIRDQMLGEQFQQVALESQWLYRRFVNNPDFGRTVSELVYGQLVREAECGAVARPDTDLSGAAPGRP